MTIPNMLQSDKARSGASEEALRDAEHRLGLSLPEDYSTFLRSSDGFEGFLAGDIPLTLWSSSEMVQLNEGYRVSEVLPGVALLGSDGAGTAYGFRRRQGRIDYIDVPFVVMCIDDIRVIGDTFEEALRSIAASGMSTD